MVLILGLVGCGCDGEVGGPAATASKVSAWMDTWAAWSSPVEICGVEVVEGTPAGPSDPDTHVVGNYNRTTRRIQVKDLPEDDLRGVLLHELCHAIDFQSGSPHRDGPWTLDPQSPDSKRSENRTRAEAFAEWCAVGPERLALSTRDEAADMLEVAWPNAPVPTAPARRERRGDPVDAPDGSAFDDASVLEDGVVGLVSVEPRNPNSGDYLPIDAATCVPVDELGDQVSLRGEPAAALVIGCRGDVLDDRVLELGGWTLRRGAPESTSGRATVELTVAATLDDAPWCLWFSGAEPDGPAATWLVVPTSQPNGPDDPAVFGWTGPRCGEDPRWRLTDGVLTADGDELHVELEVRDLRDDSLIGVVDDTARPNSVWISSRRSTSPRRSPSGTTPRTPAPP